MSEISDPQLSHQPISIEAAVAEEESDGSTHQFQRGT
jgi:hypothetical protein